MLTFKKKITDLCYNIKYIPSTSMFNKEFSDKSPREDILTEVNMRNSQTHAENKDKRYTQ